MGKLSIALSIEVAGWSKELRPGWFRRLSFSRSSRHFAVSTWLKNKGASRRKHGHIRSDFKDNAECSKGLKTWGRHNKVAPTVQGCPDGNGSSAMRSEHMNWEIMKNQMLILNKNSRGNWSAPLVAASRPLCEWWRGWRRSPAENCTLMGSWWTM